MKNIILTTVFLLNCISLFSQTFSGVYKEVNDSLENDGDIILKWNRKFEYSDRTRYNCFGGRHSIKGKWKISNDTLICKSKFYYEEETIDYESFVDSTSDSIIFIITNEKNEPLQNIKIRYYRNSAFNSHYISDSSGKVFISKKSIEEQNPEVYYKNSAAFSILYSIYEEDDASMSTSIELNQNKVYIRIVQHPKSEIVSQTAYFKIESNKLIHLKTQFTSNFNLEQYDYWKNKEFIKTEM